jgi:hypothetical protein
MFALPGRLPDDYVSKPLEELPDATQGGLAEH